MLVKVAVVAQNEPELEAIRHRLKNPLRFMVREFLTLDEVKSGLHDFSAEVLLLRIHQFTAKNVPMLMKVRAAFPDTGLVMMANEVEPGARFQVRSMPHAKILEERTEVDDLALMVEKLARKDDHPLRLHVRMKRESHAEIVDPILGTRTPARFVNFAQMGAGLCVQTAVPLKKNDRLQVHYHSSAEPGKIHRIEAMVIWGTMMGGIVNNVINGPQQMVGLRFIAAL